MKPDIILAGVLAKKHTFTLPLNYQNPIAEQIQVFARELCSPENKDKKLPYIVFFQGGPDLQPCAPPATAAGSAAH